VGKRRCSSVVSFTVTKPRCVVCVLDIPRYKTHPLESRGWGTLRVSLHSAKHSELICADEMAAAILLVAGFTGFGAERLFFAIADGAEAIGGDAQRD
jgi:hypothetical protein